MSERHLFHLRLLPDLRMELECAAQENHRSLTAEILNRLQKSLDEPKQSGEKENKDSWPEEPHIDVQAMLRKGQKSAVTAGVPDQSGYEIEGNLVREPGLSPETLEDAILRHLRALPVEKRALVLSILKLVA